MERTGQARFADAFRPCARMTLPGLLVSLVGQVMLAGLLFMVVVISGTGVGNRRPLSPSESTVIDASLWGLPALCVAAGVVLVVLYALNVGPVAYALHLVPIAAAAAYLFYVLSL